MTNPVIFKFFAKKTEEEWNRAVSQFAKRFSDAAFRIAGMAIVLSAVGVAQRESDDVFILALKIVLHGSFVIYLYSIFVLDFKIEVFNEDIEKLKKILFYLNWLLTAIVGIGLYLVSLQIIYRLTNFLVSVEINISSS